MRHVHVTLDTNANPPVSVDPDVQDVEHGNHTITWKRRGGQAFTFKSLTGLPNPPFGAPNISDDEITVTDDNTSPVAYSYTIVVTYNNQDYSTAPTRPNIALQANNGPVINNR